MIKAEVTRDAENVVVRDLDVKGYTSEIIIDAGLLIGTIIKELDGDCTMLDLIACVARGIITEELDGDCTMLDLIACVARGIITEELKAEESESDIQK